MMVGNSAPGWLGAVLLNLSHPCKTLNIGVNWIRLYKYFCDTWKDAIIPVIILREHSTLNIQK